MLFGTLKTCCTYPLQDMHCSLGNMHVEWHELVTVGHKLYNGLAKVQ